MTLRPANYKYFSNEGTSLKEIGPVYADIELLNFSDVVLNQRGYLPKVDIRGIRIKALANSGAFELVINSEIKQRLDLCVIEKRTVVLDEGIEEAEIVGPVEVRFENQINVVRAMVLPNTEEILLGRFPRAGLHTFIDPEKKQLLVMPYIPIKKIA
jgi:hypothetical protein